MVASPLNEKYCLVFFFSSELCASFLAKEETEMQEVNHEHKNVRTAGGVKSSILFLDLNNFFLPKSLPLPLPKSVFKNTQICEKCT